MFICVFLCVFLCQDAGQEIQQNLDPVRSLLKRDGYVFVIQARQVLKKNLYFKDLIFFKKKIKKTHAAHPLDVLRAKLFPKCLLVVSISISISISTINYLHVLRCCLPPPPHFPFSAFFFFLRTLTFIGEGGE